MSGSSRPNLGGLFNGSVPPERPRRINGAPTLTVAPPRAEPQGSAENAEAPAATSLSARSVPDWLDPVKAVEQYFAVLRALLDVNRDVAVAVTRAVVSLPQRVGLRR